MTKQQRVNQIKKLVSLIESKTGKKIKFEEKSLSKKEKIDEVKRIVNLIQKQTGKKVIFKEASGDAEGNKIVSDLQRLLNTANSLKAALSKIKFPVFHGVSEDEGSNHFVDVLINSINTLIQEETQHTEKQNWNIDPNSREIQKVEEDVDMDIDQITSEPQVVDKLNQKKININLVDKNRNNTGSSSSTVNTIGV